MGFHILDANTGLVTEIVTTMDGDAHIINVDINSIASGVNIIGGVNIASVSSGVGIENIGGVLVTGMPATEVHLGEVGGRTILASGSYTRPSNTTQYGAGDQVTNDAADALKF